MGGAFEQWSNKNKIQRDHTLGTLWHKSLSQTVSAGWLNKCCFQGKADHPRVYWKSSHVLVLSRIHVIWNTMGNWKILQCCDKMECCMKLKYFLYLVYEYFMFCLIYILLTWFKSLSKWLFAQTQIESPNSPTKAGEIHFATCTVPFINLCSVQFNFFH